MAFGKKIRLYYDTLRYLTRRQVYYRVFYFIRGLISSAVRYEMINDSEIAGIEVYCGYPLKKGRWNGKRSFEFLNVGFVFSDRIDWDYDGLGKLWTYNLNYFEYLLDENCTEEESFDLMYEYMHAEPRLVIGKMPYPVSLRVFNWIKTMVRFRRFDPDLVGFVRCDLVNLSKNLEFHVLGNHLLENAMAMSFGGMALDDDRLFNIGYDLLEKELKVQILADGCHVERSPMYQQILLERMLDCLNLKTENHRHDRLRSLLEPVVVMMFSWLRNMTFENGWIPMMNDASFGVSMSTSDLLEYANLLGIRIPSNVTQMTDSGYRRYDRGGFQCIVDAGDIGPDYLLAHAHSDTLSFCLNWHETPIVVDTGTSTYVAGPVRQTERGTKAHNTVVVDGMEQSEVWASFRVARRAHARIISESDSHIRATHDGYRRINASHVREFRFEDESIFIHDEVEGGQSHTAYLHFSPGIDPVFSEEGSIIADKLRFRFSGALNVLRKEYLFAQGFNRRVDAVKAEISFKGRLETVIEHT